MNTLDDLRSTLAHEADFEDLERHMRPGLVRARVRSARRRRAGTAVLAAAAAVLVVVGGSLLVRSGPSTPEPSGPTSGYGQAPGHIDVLGTPYRFYDVEQPDADGRIDVAVPAEGSTDYVTLMATGLRDGRATLWSGPFPIARLRGDQELAAPAPLGGGQLRIELEGAPASAEAEVAFYHQAGRRTEVHSGLAPREVLGTMVQSELDFNGRSWRLEEVLDADGGGPIDVDTSDGDVYIGAAHGDVTSLSLSWWGAPEGGWASLTGRVPSGPGTLGAGLLLAGDRTVQVDVTGPSPDPQVRLLVYRPE